MRTRHAIRSTTMRRLGFTLTEILVAIAVLLVVVVVTGRVFKVATDVTSAGQATVDIMQEAAAIESRIREDISKMSREGFMAIHSVAVPNDINIQQWEDDGQFGERPALLNPTLEPGAVLRCDQLVFFKEAVDSSQGYSAASVIQAYPSAQAMSSMIYYGHGIQLPDLKPFTPASGNPSDNGPGSPPAGFAHDPDASDPLRELLPWRYDNPALDEDQWLSTVYTDYSSTVANLYQQQVPEEEHRYINATQPEARKWLMVRRQVLLGDDDKEFPGNQSKRQYMLNVPSAMSIFPYDPRLNGGNQIGGANPDPNVLSYGRIDVAACPLDDVREILQVSRHPSDPTGYGYVMRRCATSEDQVDWEDAVPDDVNPIMEPRAILDGSLFPLPPGTYFDQRFLMKNVFHWPRAERVPPGNEKVDQVLTSHTIGSACSSFMIEWAWAEGTGEANTPCPWPNKVHDWWHGVHYQAGDPLLQAPQADDPAWVSEPWLGQRWFGLRDIDRGVMPFAEFAANYPPLGIDTYPKDQRVSASPFAVDPYAIDLESPTFGAPLPYEEYWATFGLNQEEPYMAITKDYNGDGFDDLHLPDHSFTPWPTALRITMTIHDPDSRLEQGQVYQFIVEIPRQAAGNHAGGM